MGALGPSRAGLVSRISLWCAASSFIRFPKTPWNEAGIRCCPDNGSGEGAAGGAWGLSRLQQLQPYLQPQGQDPWPRLPLWPGTPGPCHAHHLQLVGSRPWPPTPQLQGAEAVEVMHAEETLLVAAGNDIADLAARILQRWPQFQDVLGTAQA